MIGVFLPKGPQKPPFKHAKDGVQLKITYCKSLLHPCRQTDSKSGNLYMQETVTISLNFGYKVQFHGANYMHSAWLME